MEKGFGFHPDFAPSKDSGGRAEQKKREEREQEFERMMGGPDSKIIKARNDLLDTRASGVGLTYEEIINAMVKAGYPKAFKEAVHAKGVKTGGDEWKKLTDELRSWCLLQEDNLPEKSAEPAKTTVTSEPPNVNKEKKENTQEPVKTRKFEVKTVEELNNKMLEFKDIPDLSIKAQMLRGLARHLYENGKTDWGNAVTEEMNRQMEKASNSNVEGLPKNQDSAADWRKWIRAREASLLDPSVGEVKNVNEAFNVMAETSYLGKVERRPVNGANYLKNKELRAELIEGKKADDGTVEMKSELEASVEIGKLYSDWREVHKKLAFMITAIEGGKYRLPDNNLNKRILNEIKSEDGQDKEGGSKNIAKALRLYWAMAHSIDPDKKDIKGDLVEENEGKRILRSEGLWGNEGLQNIFDSQLPVEEIKRIRGKIAEKCGGAYYENIGLMYASFYGVSAYGSDKTIPRVEYADAMGRLVHTEINRFSNQKDKDDPNKRSSRYLDDTIANSLYEIKNGKKVLDINKPIYDGKGDNRKIVGYEPTLVQIGVHSDSFQQQVEMAEPRAFYIIRDKTEKGRYKIIKKLGVGPDYAKGIKDRDPEDKKTPYVLNTDKYEEVLFEDVIKKGMFNDIDWGNSEDLSAIMVSREKECLNVYKMYKNLDDDLTKLTPSELISRRDTFESAMPQYNLETQHHIMYLWLHSLINKNITWPTEKKDKTSLMIDDAVDKRLISEKEARDLKKTFYLGALGDASTLFDGKTYSAKSMIKSIFGKR